VEIVHRSCRQCERRSAIRSRLLASRQRAVPG
jgi:hypothetical protein